MAHLTIWKLTNSLRKLQEAKDLVYEHLDAGHQPPKSSKNIEHTSNAYFKLYVSIATGKSSRTFTASLIQQCQVDTAENKSYDEFCFFDFVELIAVLR
ncbi:hypothetical protein T4E_10911 [Trichinella pseudospiralis]|uniref:Uncharacterized protein n=1 Tax=Trichinella pseudospiralis TaxID=6337 RepID=A0A0V0XP60_TRIPS|nr:hypothetical protein T4E_10911 [Trichinella pseudospiralis]